MLIISTMQEVIVIILVIDNKKNISYGNIFDTTHNSSHATLRMVFQFSLPVPLMIVTPGLK
jgi:hypothetical protein